MSESDSTIDAHKLSDDELDNVSGGNGPPPPKGKVDPKEEAMKTKLPQSPEEISKGSHEKEMKSKKAPPPPPPIGGKGGPKGP